MTERASERERERKREREEKRERERERERNRETEGESMYMQYEQCLHRFHIFELQLFMYLNHQLCTRVAKYDSVLHWHKHASRTMTRICLTNHDSTAIMYIGVTKYACRSSWRICMSMQNGVRVGDLYTWFVTQTHNNGIVIHGDEDPQDAIPL